MNIYSLSLHAIVVGAALASSGCASIISGRTASVTIDSNPSHADVVIHDKHGQEVIATHTPARVELRRKDKFIWPAKYTATITKPGYKTTTVPINSTLNPWIAGNVIVGGPFGLAIDSATGAGWKPKVAAIHSELEPMYVAQQPPPVSDEFPPAQNVEQATAVY
jgi:hypothetical protein